MAEYSVRLDTLLRGWGAATKKQARQLIAEGRITVDGVPAEDGSQRCSPGVSVSIDGTPVRPGEPVTLMLHKPAGYASVSSGTDYPSVFSLLGEGERGLALFAVGRLDADTSGLLLLTNSGELSERISRPERAVPKTYSVTCDRPLCENAAELLAAGAVLPNGTRCRPAALTVTGERSALITVTEGKYHEVKRLIRLCGAYVSTLRRISIGGLALDPALKPGEYRPLTEEELALLFRKGTPQIPEAVTEKNETTTENKARHKEALWKR